MKRKKGFYEKFIKFPQDFLLALIAVIILSPVMLVVAILVKIKIGGPILFKQERPGLNGKIFKMYKFRTMNDIFDENGNALHDDERVTKFGLKLRRLSLDELPSLFNVLKGDISLVGPRPLLPRYLPRYNARQARRHEVKPGITGLAQVNGRNAITWEERLEYDVKYVDKITFCGDWKILFKTVGEVFKKEGISAAGLTTMEEFMGSKETNETNEN